MIPLSARQQLMVHEQSIREGLAHIQPPEERTRAEQIYWTARNIGETHLTAAILGLTVGGAAAFIIAVVCLGPEFQLFGQLARKVGIDAASASFLAGMLIPVLGALAGLVTIRPFYLRWRKPRLWEELDALLEGPNTPLLLEQIARADPRFREVIPDLLVR